MANTSGGLGTPLNRIVAMMMPPTPAAASRYVAVTSIVALSMVCLLVWWPLARVDDDVSTNVTSTRTSPSGSGSETGSIRYTKQLECQRAPDRPVSAPRGSDCSPCLARRRSVRDQSLPCDVVHDLIRHDAMGGSIRMIVAVEVQTSRTVPVDLEEPTGWNGHIQKLRVPLSHHPQEDFVRGIDPASFQVLR